MLISKEPNYFGRITKMQKNKKREFPTWDDYIVNRFKKDSEFFKRSTKFAVKDFFETGDEGFFRETLKQAAAAKGITNLARETGLSRQYLYEMLSEKGNPTLATFRLVLKALGFKMYIRAVKSV